MKTILADLDEIVFTGRNKDYGSYRMRKDGNRLLMRAALIAFLVFLFSTGLPKIISWLGTGGEGPEEELVMIPIEMELEDLPPPEEREEEVEPPPPPPPVEAPPPAAIAQIEFAVIEPAPEEEADTTEVREMDELLEADTAMIGNRDVEGVADDGTGDPNWDAFGDGDGEPQEVVVVDEDPDPSAFVIVEEEPRPVNMDNIKKAIGYPAMAKEAEIEGKVIVRVLVDKQGKYKKHVVLKDPHPILTKAVEKKLNMLQFTPGIQGGQPIKVWVTIPFDFKLLK